MQFNAMHYMHSSLLQGLEKEFLKPHPESHPEATARSAVRSRCRGRRSRQTPTLLVTSWHGADLFPRLSRTVVMCSGRRQQPAGLRNDPKLIPK